MRRPSRLRSGIGHVLLDEPKIPGRFHRFQVLSAGMFGTFVEPLRVESPDPRATESVLAASDACAFAGAVQRGLGNAISARNLDGFGGDRLAAAVGQVLGQPVDGLVALAALILITRDRE